MDGCPAADYPDDEWMSEEINATIRNIADCRSMMEWRGLFHLITRNFIFLHIWGLHTHLHTYVRTYLTRAIMLMIRLPFFLITPENIIILMSVPCRSWCDKINTDLHTVPGWFLHSRRVNNSIADKCGRLTRRDCDNFNKRTTIMKWSRSHWNSYSYSSCVVLSTVQRKPVKWPLKGKTNIKY